MPRRKTTQENTQTAQERQQAATKKYRGKKETKTKYAAYQKEKFKNIGASFKRAEALYIADTFKAHDITPAEILRGAAAALLDGQTIRTEREPLTIPPECQTADSQASTGATDTDEPPTT